MDEEFSKNPNDMELEEQIIDEDDLKSVQEFPEDNYDENID